MVLYKDGSKGDDVERIQRALKAIGIYQGKSDGIFGPQTQAAVEKFQNEAGLKMNGVVGPDTWAKLFPTEGSSSKTVTGDINTRCLALTGSFETGRLAPECFAVSTGNFDGQGMSFGALQWNFGQGTLQPLLQEMLAEHYHVATTIFGDNLDQLHQGLSGGKDAIMSFAASIQDQRKKIIAPWSQMFKALGLTPEFQAIETKGAQTYYSKAVKLCNDYGLCTLRGRALMFDICVQNGSIPDKVRELIMADFQNIPSSLSTEEIEMSRMRSVANRRAEAANPKFIEDVRTRKLCIAEGKGIVHGIAYDLAAQFGLDLQKAD